ncbi:heme exporter protein CcmD [Bartonella tamiae]|uniref:Heme exporter protein D n=1 Tax=Bartonella tamiae Th239 TaxID=1094558 RepID=J0QYP2_9HYPH|nr:heme exporter protein CcmD [Bartonella tamiae]EJF91231.1 hypothetical protein ME5_00563 [Bartonella tamiae Th239]EJF93104.1 hypothetical protein MEG_01318 [Bartonella tamiae Th307]
MNDVDPSTITHGFFAQIDIWLGTLSHNQIVILSYSIAAFVLFVLIIYIIVAGKRENTKLLKLEAMKQTQIEQNKKARHKTKNG